MHREYVFCQTHLINSNFIDSRQSKSYFKTIDICNCIIIQTLLISSNLHCGLLQIHREYDKESANGAISVPRQNAVLKTARDTATIVIIETSHY